MDGYMNGLKRYILSLLERLQGYMGTSERVGYQVTELKSIWNRKNKKTYRRGKVIHKMRVIVFIAGVMMFSGYWYKKKL